VKAEYLHVDLGSQNIAFLDPFGRRTTFTSSFRDDIFRAGLNYKLDWASPVVTRY